jgi:hypothetical protein
LDSEDLAIGASAVVGDAVGVFCAKACNPRYKNPNTRLILSINDIYFEKQIYARNIKRFITNS